MKIGFIGDVHGSWSDLHAAIEKIDADTIVQVGDFGFWPGVIENLHIDRPIYFVDGNHEHFELLWQSVDRDLLEPQEVYPNVFYLPRGTVVEWGGMRFACMGGAVSIDRHMRTEGYDWFRDEIPSYGEMMHLANEQNIDVVIAHDAPEWAIGERVANKQDAQSKGNRMAMGVLCDVLRPKYWVHGHYHFCNEATHHGTICVGLACAPDCFVLDIGECLTQV